MLIHSLAVRPCSQKQCRNQAILSLRQAQQAGRPGVKWCEELTDISIQGLKGQASEDLRILSCAAGLKILQASKRAIRTIARRPRPHPHGGLHCSRRVQQISGGLR